MDIHNSTVYLEIGVLVGVSVLVALLLGRLHRERKEAAALAEHDERTRLTTARMSKSGARLTITPEVNRDAKAETELVDQSIEAQLQQFG